MELKLYMADPAGNRTALVATPAAAEMRPAAAREIMDMPGLRAEQVGFITDPRNAIPETAGSGGLRQAADGRLEMMGGEFCGNAARSYGMLLCRLLGRETVTIEMSGAPDPLQVFCDLQAGTASAQMPMPLRLVKASVLGREYPLVESEGISHLIVLSDQTPSADFINAAVEEYGSSCDAFGIQFAGSGGTLKPAVFVRDTGSLTYESSCGSGSLAAAWYLTRDKDDGSWQYSFSEPGGTINVTIVKKGDRYSGVIGGSVSLSELMTVTISDL